MKMFMLGSKTPIHVNDKGVRTGRWRTDKPNISNEPRAEPEGDSLRPGPSLLDKAKLRGINLTKMIEANMARGIQEAEDKIAFDVIDDVDRPKNKAKVAFIFGNPKPEITDIDTLIAGPFAMSEVLHIPSDNLLWVEDEPTKIRDAMEMELRKRYPAPEGFLRFLYIHRDATNMGVWDLDLRTYHSVTAYMVLSRPFFTGTLDQGTARKKAVDELYRQAKAGEEPFISPNVFGRIRPGFVSQPIYLGGRCWPSIHKLVYDPKAHKEDRAKREARLILPPKLVDIYALRRIEYAMIEVLRNKLATKPIGIVFDFKSGSKAQVIEAVLGLHKMGTKLFGDDFWKKVKWPKGYGPWNPQTKSFDKVHPLKGVVERWTKTRAVPPKTRLGQKLWDMIWETSGSTPAGTASAASKE